MAIKTFGSIKLVSANTVAERLQLTKFEVAKLAGGFYNPSMKGFNLSTNVSILGQQIEWLDTRPVNQLLDHLQGFEYTISKDQRDAAALRKLGFTRPEWAVKTGVYLYIRAYDAVAVAA